MTLVDREGRLFGRLNLVDAVLLTLALGLVPLGFVAYRLFRTPIPVLTAVEPASFDQGSIQRVMIHGLNLRPYMRVSFDTVQGRSFLFEDSTKAQIELREMVPGVYDVVLYDQWQERARLPKALTIKPPADVPRLRIVVVGTLANVKAEDATQLKPGLVLPGVGEVLQVGRAVAGASRVRSGTGWVEVPEQTGLRLPVSILAACTVAVREERPDCGAFEGHIDPNALVSIGTPFGARPFLIDEVRSPAPLQPVQVRVRFAGDPGALLQIKDGDVDTGAHANELAARSTVVRAAAVNRRTSEEATRDVDVVVQAQQSSSSWTFAAQPLRIGGDFLLRTSLYELRGQVIALSPGPAPDMKGAAR